MIVKARLITLILTVVNKQKACHECKTVKLALLRELVEAGSVRSAAIIGLPGGYAVQVRYGISDRALAARTGEVRVFAKIDAAAKTLRGLGVVTAELDLSGYSPGSVLSKRRPDRAQALKDAHKALHDKSFRDPSVRKL